MCDEIPNSSAPNFGPQLHCSLATLMKFHRYYFFKTWQLFLHKSFHRMLIYFGKIQAHKCKKSTKEEQNVQKFFKFCETNASLS